MHDLLKRKIADRLAELTRDGTSDGAGQRAALNRVLEWLDDPNYTTAMPNADDPTFPTGDLRLRPDSFTVLVSKRGGAVTRIDVFRGHLYYHQAAAKSAEETGKQTVGTEYDIYHGNSELLT